MGAFVDWSLIFADEYMNDNKMLKDQNITNGSVVHLVQRPQSRPPCISWPAYDVWETYFRLYKCTYKIVKGKADSNEILVIVKSLKRIGLFIANENSKITDLSKIEWLQ